MSAVCPECAQGKDQNCVGQALDPVTDDFVTCASVPKEQVALPAWMNLRQLRSDPFVGYHTGNLVWSARCTSTDHCTGFFITDGRRDVVVQRAYTHLDRQHGGAS